jgi:hypothetical protein
MRRGTSVGIAVYRTQEDPFTDSPFRRVSSLDPTATGDNGYCLNDPTVNTVTFVDNLTDALLLQRDIDYQTGGEQPNVAQGPARSISGGQDRLFTSGYENPNLVQYSKLHFPGTIATNSDVFQIIVDEEGGPVTGHAFLNQTLIIFKESKIYRVDGIGLDNRALGQPYITSIVMTDLGCVDSRSISTYGGGIVFKSKKGYWLLDKNLDVQYCGAQVEAYNGQNCTGSAVLPDRNQIIFLTSDQGPTAVDSERVHNTLMYDYLFAQWGTFANNRGSAMTVWRDNLVFCRHDGKIVQETPAQYSDSGRYITRVVELGYLHIAQLMEQQSGLQGYQRIGGIAIIGHWKGLHKLRVKYNLNYEPGFKFTRDWDPTPVINQSIYGDSTYGVGIYGGSGSRNPQAILRPAIQKCQSIKIRIEDLPYPVAEDNEASILSGLTIKMAPISGLAPMSKERKFGLR